MFGSRGRAAGARRGGDDLGLLIRFGVAAAAAEVVGALVTANATDITAPPWLVGAAAACGVLLLAAGTLAMRTYRSPPTGRPLGSSRRTRTDRETGGLRRVERMIDTGLLEADRFNLRVRPWLTEIADQRLRHRASVSLTNDPDTARELLGDSLWQLTQQPLTAAPTRADLTAWVTRLEAL